MIKDELLINKKMKSKTQLKCIFCGQPLTRRNRSEEHIIPENIGGKLTSRNIICSNCNNNFGRKIDNFLLETYRPIDLLYNPKKIV